jgi:putative transposase
MKASKFSDAQKAFIKQSEDGMLVAEICRKAGISQVTFFNWKKKYAGLLPSEMKRLRELLLQLLVRPPSEGLARFLRISTAQARP